MDSATQFVKLAHPLVEKKSALENLVENYLQRDTQTSAVFDELEDDYEPSTGFHLETSRNYNSKIQS
jgi:hypothetical protein